MKMHTNEGRDINKLIRTFELVGYHSDAEEDFSLLERDFTLIGK
jgi:hypothetical protein